MKATGATRWLDARDVADMAVGAAFLGSGGGGDPYAALLELHVAMTEGGRVALVDPAGLADDALVAPCGWIGAPTVSAEKLPGGQEAVLGLRRLEQITGRSVAAVMPIEIGGSNGLAPLLLAVRAGIPVLDCDGMGRAFPESQMVVFNIQGQRASPAILTDEKGACVTIDTDDNNQEERLARTLSIAMGGTCHMIDYSMSAAMARRHAVPGTVSLAISIGRGIREARAQGRDPFDGLFGALRAAVDYGHAGILFDGKIVDLQCETKQGFSIGRLVVASFDGASRMELEFRNENLIARQDGRVRAMVPDILSVLDRETAETITTERLKYGQRVKIVAAAVPRLLRSDAALAVLGPEVFGYPGPYQPVERLNGWV